MEAPTTKARATSPALRAAASSFAEAVSEAAVRAVEAKETPDRTDADDGDLAERNEPNEERRLGGRSICRPLPASPQAARADCTACFTRSWAYSASASGAAGASSMSAASWQWI